MWLRLTDREPSVSVRGKTNQAGFKELSQTKTNSEQKKEEEERQRQKKKAEETALNGNQ